jgi:threonine/homoserine/homoserine lactone efflux protein
MADVVGQILTFAVGIAISPIPIIAVILILFSTRARMNGPAFLLGWIVGVTAVTVIVLVVSNGADVGSDSGANNTVSGIKLVLGILLIAGGIRHFRNRPAPGAEVEMPKWMTAIDAFSPAKALGAGVVLSALNPKNLILAAGGAAQIAQANLSTSKEIGCVVIFVLVSSVSIGGAVLLYLFGGDKAQRVLNGWKAWLSQNNATVMAVLLVVIGVALAGKGLDVFD